MDQELQPREDEQKPDGNFFSRLGWLFFSPSKLFADIARQPAWWQPWAWVSLFGMAGVYFAKPITMAVVKLNPGNIDPDQVQQTLDTIDKFMFAGYFLAPISSLVQALIISSIGYLVLMVIVEGVDFKRYFTLFLYSNIIVAAGSLLSTVLVWQRGTENIHRPEDAAVSFGLDFLVPEGNKAFETVVSSLNVFTVWSLVIIGFGVMRIFRASRNQGIVAVVPIWLVYLVFGLMLSLISPGK